MAYNRWLAHHGVKDQKWGVKNGPPYPLDSSKSDGHKLLKSDGSPQGKKRTKVYHKNAKKANAIYNTLSDREKYFLTGDPKAKQYVEPSEYRDTRYRNLYSRIEQYNDIPVSVMDIWSNEQGGATISIAVNADYRHMGLADKAVVDGITWLNDHPDVQYLVWGAEANNIPSITLAKKHGFEEYSRSGDHEYVNLTLDNKRAMTNGRPLTEKVRSRTDADREAIEEAQKYDDKQHRRILNGANFLAKTKALAFKIGRYNSASENGIPIKKQETSKDYDLKVINPGGKSTTLSGSNNCLLCTVAYDMRRRGYNVMAKQRAPIELLYDIGDEDLTNMYKSAKTIRDDSLKGITNKFKRQKNSRGSISCTWNGSKSGHVVAYEVNNGKVTLYDAQAGKRYDNPEELFSDAHNFRAVRLDNITPDYRLIKLAVE